MLVVGAAAIDDFEVTQQLRNDERTRHILIVLLTAREDRERLFRGLNERADEYLTKPVDAEELKLRLRNLIDVRQILRRKAAAECPVLARSGPAHDSGLIPKERP